jgi:excisionase family DNA binding protein
MALRCQKKGLKMPNPLVPENHDEYTDNDDRLLTIKEVSKLTGLAVGTLYHLAAEGRIPATRLSRRCLRFRLSALKKWLDDSSQYPSPPVSKGEDERKQFGKHKERRTWK